jgi:hypothetical protein
MRLGEELPDYDIAPVGPARKALVLDSRLQDTGAWSSPELQRLRETELLHNGS